MNKSIYIILALVGILVMNSCSDDEFLSGNPDMELGAGKVSALYGDSLPFTIKASDVDVPLSTLKAKLFYEDASVSEDQMIMALKTMANNVVPMPNIPEMDVMWSVTDDLLAAVNKRGEDVQTACDAHQKEALEQISAMQ